MCLESRWYKRNPITVQPLLETLRLINGIHYSHFPCNSEDELKRHLSIIPSEKNGVLLIASHGERGNVSFSEKKNVKCVPLEKISEMILKKYE